MPHACPRMPCAHLPWGQYYTRDCHSHDTAVIASCSRLRPEGPLQPGASDVPHLPVGIQWPPASEWSTPRSPHRGTPASNARAHVLSGGGGGGLPWVRVLSATRLLLTCFKEYGWHLRFALSLFAMKTVIHEHLLMKNRELVLGTICKHVWL